MVNFPEVQHISDSDSDITVCGENEWKVNCLLAEWLKTHRKHFAVHANHSWTLPIWTLAKLALMNHHTIAATNIHAVQKSGKSVAFLWHTYIHMYIHTYIYTHIHIYIYTHTPTLQTIKTQFIRMYFPSTKQRHIYLGACVTLYNDAVSC